MSERSIRILLAVSLALNIFVLGAAAGAGYMWQAQEGQPRRGASRLPTSKQLGPAARRSRA
ncbi:hypothetical protein [Mesorhizobium sp.]|uniref:hypothetical protein n=1 Tax=Mesorhizobium sp. TaxID=1871066 RepID=UPI0025D57CB2|nr:hypothetical protein [Mesorhizobium sp.]